MSLYSKIPANEKKIFKKYSAFFFKVRSIIISIYDYKCQICQVESLILEIHHYDKDNQNDDPFNLIPLCSRCHKAVHRGIKFKRPILNFFQRISLTRLKMFLHKSII